MKNLSKLPEIVAPAGNLEKLKFAVLFGADAVYFGGSEHNLRAQSDNFSGDDIEEGVRFCHNNGAKAVFLLNSFLHEKDIIAAKWFIDGVKAIPFDAVMISDPAMMTLIRDAGMTCAVHLSTQMSTLNHLSVQFWHNAGITRIVLAREATIDEIRMIMENTDAELEVFVHGALCIAYSGRCLLSRYLAGRDANQGDCAQACRWRYSLVEESRPGDPLDIIENRAGTEILSSKDLCLMERIGQYIDAGVRAFKIEGRMKSVYYTANTTRIYRDAVRTAGTAEFDRRLPFYREELDLVSHRPYTDDLFNEFDGEGFSGIKYINKVMFLGYRNGSDPLGVPIFKTFNPIYRGETVEAIFPITGSIRDGRFTVKEIIDTDGASVEMARPNALYRISFDANMGDHAILRRRS